MDYFYRQYLKFTTWLIPSLKDMGLTEYSTVFVGHSLGGAMAVHAAVDVIMSRFWAINSMKVYTYGHPRVGNLKFEEILS